MTDADRIVAARALLAEIAYALDCAQVAMAQEQAAMREAAILAAMGAAEGIIKGLGGRGGYEIFP